MRIDELNRQRPMTAAVVWFARALVTAASLAVLAASALAASGDIYNLGTLGCCSESYSHAVNAHGQVAGFNTNFGSPQHAFVYAGTPGSGGAMADLGTLNDKAIGPGSVAYGINASGQVVGDSYDWESYITRAFLYTGTPDSGGAMVDLGDLFPDFGGTAQSFARGVNASGQVVGFSNARGGTHAFLYTSTPGSGGAMADLGTFTGRNGSSYAYGINAGGQVVGDSFLAGQTDAHAFLYTGTPGSGGAMADLGTLPGKPYSRGLAINDVGQVVGYSGNWFSDTNATNHAFLYTGTPGSGGAMADLGTLGGAYSVGRAINISGQVVGDSHTAAAVEHAFLYTGTPGVDGHMIDLDTWLNANNPTEGAKWTLISAAGVTDAGLITGVGNYNDGPGGLPDGTRAFLLDASALVSTSLPGDYNHNGVVDAADYVVWRKSQGTTNVLPNDPTGGTIGATQYNTWRTHFGPSVGSGAAGYPLGASVEPLSAAVPEPATVVLVGVALAAMFGAFSQRSKPRRARSRAKYVLLGDNGRDANAVPLRVLRRRTWDKAQLPFYFCRLLVKQFCVEGFCREVKFGILRGIHTGDLMHLALLRRFGILAALACSQPCWAIPIQVNYEAAFVPNGGEQPLPIYVDNNDPNPNSVRFRFSVPDAAEIGSLNSVRVLVDVYDDGDNPNNETGEVLFILNGIGQSNFTVASFGSGLNGTTSGSPLTVGEFVKPADFDDVLAEIKDDGVFFVRLSRTGGDYFVQDATVTIDANLVPEPATVVLIGIAFIGVVSRRRVRRAIVIADQL